MHEINMRRHADLVILVCRFAQTLLRRNRQVHSLALATHFHLQRLPPRAAHLVHKLVPILDLLPIHGANHVASLQSRAACRCARSHFADCRKDWQVPENMSPRIIRHRHIHMPCRPAILHLHAQRAAGFRCAHNLQRLFPGRILRSIHRNHFLSGFQSIHRFAAHRRKLVHHHWLALKRRVRHPCNRVVPTQQYNRKNQIHRRPRERNHRTLPTLLAHQFVRQTFRRLFPGINITDVLPRHAHVSAQGQCAHTPVRRPALDPKKPRSKPNRENIHAHSEKPRGDKVSPFVDQDNHAQDQHHADNRVHSVAVPRPFILRYAQSPAQFRPWPRSNLQSRRVPQVRFFTWVLGFLSWVAGAPGSLFYLGLGFLSSSCGTVTPDCALGSLFHSYTLPPLFLSSLRTLCSL